jgi:membrane protease YdiL (CAAX protease family)
MDDPDAPFPAPPEASAAQAERPGAESAQSPPRTPSSSLRMVFVGPKGIRAGWRLLLFLGIALSAGAAIGSVVRLAGYQASGGFTPAVAAIGEGNIFLAFLVAAAVMARIEKRSLADYGLPGRGAFGRAFWLGVIWGFAALTALLLLVWAAHGFTFGQLALSGRPLLYYAVVWAAAFLAVGFAEEFSMRGYALYTLSMGIGFWPAAILLSALFGALHLHNAAETLVGGLSAGLIGLFFCFTVRRTGTLWFAIGLHAMWDYAESFLYSVPDSGAMVPGHLLNSSFHGPRWLTGGSVGPEGSALVFVIILAFFGLFNRLYREVRFPRAAP